MLIQIYSYFLSSRRFHVLDVEIYKKSKILGISAFEYILF